jgi:hypothetical protein
MRRWTDVGNVYNPPPVPPLELIDFYLWLKNRNLVLRSGTVFAEWRAQRAQYAKDNRWPGGEGNRVAGESASHFGIMPDTGVVDDALFDVNMNANQRAEAIALHTWHVGWGKTDPEHFGQMLQGYYPDVSEEVATAAWRVLEFWLAGQDRLAQAEGPPPK